MTLLKDILSKYVQIKEDAVIVPVTLKPLRLGSWETGEKEYKFGEIQEIKYNRISSSDEEWFVKFSGGYLKIAVKGPNMMVKEIDANTYNTAEYDMIETYITEKPKKRGRARKKTEEEEGA